MDPPGILGGSDVNSRDPATMTLVKIGGSVETTASLYNFRKGDMENCSLRGDPERRRGQRLYNFIVGHRVVVRPSKCLRVLRHFREGAFGRGRRLACPDMKACACGC